MSLPCACEHCGHEFDAEPEARHRLLCGDATDPSAIDRAIGGGRPQLCLTDPPYGIGEAYVSHNDSRERLATLAHRFLPLIRARCDVVLLTPGNGNQQLYPDPEWTLAWFVPAGTGMNPWGFTCWQPILAFGRDPFLKKRKGARPDAFVMTESERIRGSVHQRRLHRLGDEMHRTEDLASGGTGAGRAAAGEGGRFE